MLIAGAPAGSTAQNVYVATSPDLVTWTFQAQPILAATDHALGALSLSRATGLVSATALWVWYGFQYDPN